MSVKRTGCFVLSTFALWKNEWVSSITAQVGKVRVNGDKYKYGNNYIMVCSTALQNSEWFSTINRRWQVTNHIVIQTLPLLYIVLQVPNDKTSI